MSAERPTTERGERDATIERIGGYLIGPAFLALAAGFLLSSLHIDVPSAPTPDIDPAAIDPSPLRQPPGDPPTIVIATYEQRCNSCHKLFRSDWDGSRPLTQHTHIHLEHGLNNQCDNCHARENREELILHDGSTVGFDQVPRLCAQCHGPVYRDWTRGVHGKTLGYWDDDQGEPRRLSCTQCHDPHSPAYEPMAPLPGPHTLRMGEPKLEHHVHVATKRNPLRMWSLEGRVEPVPHEEDPADHVPAEGSHERPDAESPDDHSHEEGASP